MPQRCRSLVPFLIRPCRKANGARPRFLNPQRPNPAFYSDPAPVHAPFVMGVSPIFPRPCRWSCGYYNIFICCGSPFPGNLPETTAVGPLQKNRASSSAPTLYRLTTGMNPDRFFTSVALKAASQTRSKPTNPPQPIMLADLIRASRKKHARAKPAARPRKHFRLSERRNAEPSGRWKERV